MDATAIATVTIPVVLLTQIIKWMGLPDNRGPLVVLALSLLAVLFWGWSHDDLTRAHSFDYFAGWVVVAAAAAGVFGFTRAAATAVTSAAPPPAGGAGSSTTVK